MSRDSTVRIQIKNTQVYSSLHPVGLMDTHRVTPDISAKKTNVEIDSNDEQSAGILISIVMYTLSSS